MQGNKAAVNPVTDRPVIMQGCRVTLHFSLSLSNGEVIDSNFERPAVSFIMGDGSLLPGFEARLMGLGAGESIEVTLPAAEAFGASKRDNVQRISRQKFNRFLDDEYEALMVGTVVAFKDAGGFDIPGVVREIWPEAVLVDFNHPLADRDIVFKAYIIAVLIRDVKTMEIKL
jgi:FKBP-type peptidyl-prolyl cis-trans isomerase SlpA